MNPTEITVLNHDLLHKGFFCSVSETSDGGLSDDSHLTLSEPFFCQDCSSLTLPVCHFPSTACSRVSLLSHHFRYTGLRSSYAAHLGAAVALKGIRVGVKVLPAARWIKMACGSHSDGNRRRHFSPALFGTCFACSLQCLRRKNRRLFRADRGPEGQGRSLAVCCCDCT